jgi:hypothetical protein
MTPEMSPGELGFTRRGESVRALLDRWWAWARRDYRSMSGLDAREKMYAACYPPTAPNRSLSEIAAAMIERRREKLTLDALASLVSNLPGLQDGRKAVLVATEASARPAGLHSLPASMPVRRGRSPSAPTPERATLLNSNATAIARSSRNWTTRASSCASSTLPIARM